MKQEGILQLLWVNKYLKVTSFLLIRESTSKLRLYFLYSNGSVIFA